MGPTTNMEERVVLVNERDEEVGTMGKLEAHQKGALHRAFSIFLYDEHGRLLMQQRASDKYHSASLWTNTCCSHPRPGEPIELASARRLQEEMGLSAELEHRFSFIYKANVGNELMEHELDHVFIGRVQGLPDPDPREVQQWRFMDITALEHEMKAAPERFTAWLHKCWPILVAELRQKRA